MLAEELLGVYVVCVVPALFLIISEYIFWWEVSAVIPFVTVTFAPSLVMLVTTLPLPLFVKLVADPFSNKPIP